MSDPNHRVELEHRQARRRSTYRRVGTTQAPRRSTSRTRDLDRHVSARIRERRIVLGLTQREFAEMIGVAFQQAHKYESGSTRVSAGRLFRIAQVLSVQIGDFFDGLDECGEQPINAHERMRVEFARTVAQISNRHHQVALSQLARTLATA